MNKGKTQDKLIMLTSTRSVYASAVNKKRHHLATKRGRPKQSDYLLSDITPFQRAQINKYLKNKRQIKRVEKKGNVLFIRMILFIGIILTFTFASYNLTDMNVKAEELITPLARPKYENATFTQTDAKEPSYCRGEINSIFCKYKDWDAKKMIAICKSENGFKMWGNKWKPDAQYTANTDGSVDTGVCMINSVHGYSAESLKDPEFNIEVAHKTWLRRPDYSAWVNHNNGNYLVYYNEMGN